MKKLLFLPFLNFPSGHHQTADALMESIMTQHTDTICKKVDIFSYSYKNLEAFISKLYLKWIHFSPRSYNELYKFMVLRNLDKEKERYIYEWFFQQQLEKLISIEKPDGIICTHALPSKLVSRLKREGLIDIPVFNVYTDYFIHRGWGVRHIDGHFISTWKMNNFLLGKGIPKEQIYFTGIPIHPQLKKKPLIPEQPRFKANILISGGSMGTGPLIKLIDQLKEDSSLHYFILCGKNMSLYKQIKNARLKNITSLPYIESRRMMDLIYNQTDLVITKPGGVTVSECIQKRIPIFIYDKLPGQEEMNFHELKAMEIIEDSYGWREYGGLNSEIKDFLYNPNRLSRYYGNVHRYDNKLLKESPAKIIMELTS